MSVRPLSMHQALPPPLRAWVEEKATSMGLPGPDDYLLLLLRLDKQNHDVERLLCDSPTPARRQA
jgi:hypothetical protein